MAPVSKRGLTTAISAFTVTVLLFVYSRSSIRAAKQDAARHRAADGGQISWRNESLRRHGVMERPDSPSVLGALFPAKEQKDDKVARAQKTISEEEEALQAAKRKRPNIER